MKTVDEVADELTAALRTIAGYRGYALGDGQIAAPAWVIGPPQLEFESPCPEPTQATFLVFVVVALDERAPERLYRAVAPFVEAIDGVTNAVVRSALPGVYSAGNQDLPCYSVSVEFGL